ncbi:hypothetical protein SHPE106448_17965 [Shewanella pealeana]
MPLCVKAVGVKAMRVKSVSKLYIDKPKPYGIFALSL